MTKNTIKQHIITWVIILVVWDMATCLAGVADNNPEEGEGPSQSIPVEEAGKAEID